MPTNSPSEMSNEDLVKRFGRDYAGLANSTDPEYDWSSLNESEDELLRRLNRAEGLEARVIAAVDERRMVSLPPNGINAFNQGIDAAKRAITATFAAVREEEPTVRAIDCFGILADKKTPDPNSEVDAIAEAIKYPTPRDTTAKDIIRRTLAYLREHPELLFDVMTASESEDIDMKFRVNHRGKPQLVIPDPDPPAAEPIGDVTLDYGSAMTIAAIVDNLCDQVYGAENDHADRSAARRIRSAAEESRLVEAANGGVAK